ncbi:MAG: hypothetical protein H6875_08465 [Hyphomicrobiaceae bacterium]|nr:hypothetical protein [Hyphomicrobiaceae bacterium]
MQVAKAAFVSQVDGQSILFVDDNQSVLEVNTEVFYAQEHFRYFQACQPL